MSDFKLSELDIQALRTQKEKLAALTESNNRLLEALEIVFNGYLAEPGEDFDWDDWALKAKAAIREARGEWE